MSKAFINESTLTDIADAIRSKTGGNSTYLPSEMAAAIESISTKPLEPKAVNFYDYDGTLIYSYTKSEAMALTELPPFPTNHENLVGESYNWTLDEIKYNLSAVCGTQIDVACFYITQDGLTHMYVEVEPGKSSLNLQCVSLTSNSQLNWGDGSGSVTIQNYLRSFSHTYSVSATCVFDVVITGGNNSTLSIGNNSSNIKSITINFASNVSKYLTKFSCKQTVSSSVYMSYNTQYSSSDVNFGWAKDFNLKYLPITRNALISGAYAFQNNINLEVVSIPPTITTIPQYGFINCVSLKNITIPATSATTILRTTCYPAQGLRTVATPPNVSFPGASNFNGCVGLTTAYINSPNMDSQMFYNCTNLKTLYVNSVTPPTGNANGAIPSSIQTIYIPIGTLADYQADSVWGTFSSKFVEIDFSTL